METIGLTALDQGMMLRVTDSSSQVVWDAFVHSHARCLQVIAEKQQSMLRRYPNFPGKYLEDTYPIKQDLVQVGTVSIGYYGPFNFTDADLKFIDAVNAGLITVGSLALVLALALGAAMAKRISQPISRVISAAERLSQGDLLSRIAEKSTTKEIVQLTDTVNDLAATLEQQDRLRKRLTGDVAHELRTPLTTLQSHLEAMIDGVWEPDATRLAACHEEIVRLTRLVGDLERLARFEGDGLVLTRTRWPLRQLVARICQNFAAEVERKGISLTESGSDPELCADQDKISQLLVNLLANAVKYTPTGGAIAVNVSETDDAVVISVRDNGEGISSDDLPHIFQRFYRADQSRNRQTGGSGIGLTIVEAIAKAHHGTVRVESQLGVGSEFIVTLPKQTK